MLAAMALASRALGNRRTRALFRGPSVVCEPRQRPFYPACRYTVAGSGPGRAASLDAITGASVSARMRSPTVYRERRPSRLLRISYPPDRAVFPPNLCRPYLEWEDDMNDVWQVTVEIDGAGLEWSAITSARRHRLPKAVWRSVCEHAVDRDARIQVLGVRRSECQRPVHASKPVRVRVSRDPADECIVYRLVTPPFSAQSSPDTLARHIGSTETRPFLSSRGRYCFNCHTFSSKSSSRGKLAIQSRYLPDDPYPLRIYFGIYDIERRHGRRVKLPFAIQMTTFSAWSPDGSKLAISANQQVGALAPIVLETQNVTVPTSDIAVYDLAANRAYLLPGASAPDRLGVYPRWTPDGKSIVFSAAAKGRQGAPVQFDLQIVPFNDGRGGEPRDIPGASHNGKSNYFARFSPDGKWLSFCQCNAGSLIKSSSDIWLMPAHLREPARPLACNARYAADSWHSWSSNSRWLVFTSKRDDGIYARLYLTHIDAAGCASPAVRLPLPRPPLACFNIPEFVTDWPGLTDDDLFETVRVQAPAVEAESGQAQ